MEVKMKKIFLVLTLMAVLTTPVLAQTDIYQLNQPVKKVGDLFPTIVHLGIVSNSSVNPAALDLASNGFIAPFDIILSTVRQSGDGSLWRTTFNTGTGQS